MLNMSITYALDQIDDATDPFKGGIRFHRWVLLLHFFFSFIISEFV